MRRRDFITLLGSAAAAWPLAARAQQGAATPVVGFLSSRGPTEDPHLITAFRQGLKEAGYVEGQSVAIEYRFAEGQYDRLPALAADLVRRRVNVIAANGPASQAAKEATATVPIVFATGFDPIEAGLIASLSRPGENITGVWILDVDLGPKRLEVLRELVPAASLIAALVNPSDPARAETTSQELQEAARTLGVQLQILQARSDQDLETAFESLVRLRAAGLVIGGDPFFNSRAEQLGALSALYAVPAIYETPEFAAGGGLASYGGSIEDAYRLLGAYTGRVLHGEKPGNLPIQQAATSVELILNLKTAKALGITVPRTLLARADKVIE
jgi:putative ABC transport system substrate-binding protein